MDFAIGLMDSVLTLPNGQKTEFLGGAQITEEMLSILLGKKVWGLVKKTFGLVQCTY